MKIDEFRLTQTTRARASRVRATQRERWARRLAPVDHQQAAIAAADGRHSRSHALFLAGLVAWPEVFGGRASASRPARTMVLPRPTSRDWRVFWSANWSLRPDGRDIVAQCSLGCLLILRPRVSFGNDLAHAWKTAIRMSLLTSNPAWFTRSAI